MEHFFSKFEIMQWNGLFNNRNSHQRCSLRKGILRNFAKFRGKHLYQSLFFNKVAGTFLKKETQAQVFSCEFCEISQNTFFIEHFWATASEERRLFKLASNKCVKTACVCIVFFFHYSKYYGQNIFSRITVLYLIAKVKEKKKTFYLKHEIIGSRNFVPGKIPTQKIST